ncbi:MAG TPA: hypothetical protein VL528_09400, partial [Oxalicibacterium sp.]|nr:hypothetical protein [Oxalicibacterium sp.]
AKLANPSLNSWKLMNGLLDAHLSESSTAALGGDLATGYAETGTFSTGVIAAQDLLRNANFGSQAQKIGNRFNCSVQNQDS